jgi:endogenous inhibitor of DNA gyrase (YacG/DUF329 family)
VQVAPNHLSYPSEISQHPNVFRASQANSVQRARKKLQTRQDHMKHKCPICKTATDSTVHADFPFCSERCRERDLGNWASEKYVVSEPIFNEDDSEEGDRKTIILDLPDRGEAEH